jgi:GcrA cell cycle regulator
MIWTDERVEMLRKLWAEGLSASQIAAQLGGVSRNAVIGKVHRLKLSGRGRTTAAPARPKKPSQPTITKPQSRPVSASRQQSASMGNTALQVRFDAEPAMRTIERNIEDIVVPISRNLQLIQLNERTCKWPIGDPLAENFHFCGNDCADTGPYCRYHARIAFQPASERRRIR